MSCIAIIAYGVEFEGDYEFPWDKEAHSFSINNWLDSKGIANSITQIGDMDGSVVLSSPSLIMKTSGKMKFNNEFLKNREQEQEKILAFCKDHNLKYEGTPAWFLINYEE